MKYEQIKEESEAGFRRLTGIKRTTFAVMITILSKAEERLKAKGGKPNKLAIEERLLMALEYLREYRTYFHISLDFYQKLGFTVELERTGFHKSSVSYSLRRELLEEEQSKTKIASLIADLEILPATPMDYPVIQNTARFYVYELSRECGFISKDWACPSDGPYESFDFKCYFEDPSRRAYLIKVKHELAGFALLNQEGTSPETDWNMGEFFILAKFQGKGIAQYVAHQLWSTYPGLWEILVIPENVKALGFWRKAVSRFSHGDYLEKVCKVTYDAHQPNRHILSFQAKQD